MDVILYVARALKRDEHEQYLESCPKQFLGLMEDDRFASDSGAEVVFD